MKGARQLTDEEIRKIAKGFSGRYAVRNRALFVLGLACGGRISELLSLTIGDVWQYNRPVEAVYFQKQNTKGKREGRAVPIKKAGKEAIRELVKWYKKSMDGLEADMPLFTSQKGGSITRQHAHEVLKDAFNKAEISGKVATHSMRKTYAHKLLKGGGNLHTVKEALGHASIATTQEYLGLDLEKFLDATPDYDLKSDILQVSSDLDDKKIQLLSERIKELERKLEKQQAKEEGKIIPFPTKKNILETEENST